MNYLTAVFKWKLVFSNLAEPLATFVELVVASQAAALLVALESQLL